MKYVGLASWAIFLFVLKNNVAIRHPSFRGENCRAEHNLKTFLRFVCNFIWTNRQIESCFPKFASVQYPVGNLSSLCHGSQRIDPHNSFGGNGKYSAFTSSPWTGGQFFVLPMCRPALKAFTLLSDQAIRLKLPK